MAVQQKRGWVQVRQAITSGKLNPTSLSVPIRKMESSKFYSITEKSELYTPAKMPSTLTHHRHSTHSCPWGLDRGRGIHSSSFKSATSMLHFIEVKYVLFRNVPCQVFYSPSSLLQQIYSEVKMSGSLGGSVVNHVPSAQVLMPQS